MTRLDGRVMRLERDRRRSAPGPCPACGIDPDAPFSLSWPDADADPTPADDPRLTPCSTCGQPALIVLDWPEAEVRS